MPTEAIAGVSLEEAQRACEDWKRAHPGVTVVKEHLPVVLVSGGGAAGEKGGPEKVLSVMIALDYEDPDQGLIAEHRKAIEIDPRDAAAHNGLGVALAALGRLDEAVAAFRRVIAIDPRIAAAHVNLGNALKNQNKTDEAVLEYRRAIEIDPRAAVAHNGLASPWAARTRSTRPSSNFAGPS